MREMKKKKWREAKWMEEIQAKSCPLNFIGKQIISDSQRKLAKIHTFEHTHTHKHTLTERAKETNTHSHSHTHIRILWDDCKNDSLLKVNYMCIRM